MVPHSRDDPEAEAEALLARHAAVRAATSMLHAMPTPAAIMARGPAALGEACGFRRVLLSRVEDDAMRPQALWIAGQPDTGLPDGMPEAIRLAYPLEEAEVLTRREARLVDARRAGARTPEALRRVLDWAEYIVVPLVLGSALAGLLHADATGTRVLDETDRVLVADAAEGLARGFEAAALREALVRHRDEQHAALATVHARLREAEAGDAVASGRVTVVSPDDSLTDRERQILDLLGRGMTNRVIAGHLSITESTVKYHVKNLLRKLGATSRADAVARRLRSGS